MGITCLFVSVHGSPDVVTIILGISLLMFLKIDILGNDHLNLYSGFDMRTLHNIAMGPRFNGLLTAHEEITTTVIQRSIEASAGLRLIYGITEVNWI